ncbi:hypothetical protein Scep_005022 [Stephania cephalantha]|uniref:Uncharacterized protein n=1 Tax=Stephania cephalantha TaxID=152367 RepID=A0AAP0KUX8_9MAGN
MYDPVIISSAGLMSELCIEKWFSDGHGNDKSLSKGIFFLELLSVVEPRVVNWSVVTKGEDGLEVIWSSVVKIGQSLYREAPRMNPFRPDQKTPIAGASPAPIIMALLGKLQFLIMSTSLTPIRDICTTKHTLEVRAKITRKWYSTNLKTDALISMDIILLDEHTNEKIAVPIELYEIVGKSFTFKLKLTNYNLASGNENFTVSSICHEEYGDNFRHNEANRTAARFPDTSPSHATSPAHLSMTARELSFLMKSRVLGLLKDPSLVRRLKLDIARVYGKWNLMSRLKTCGVLVYVSKLSTLTWVTQARDLNQDCKQDEKSEIFEIKVRKTPYTAP